MTECFFFSLNRAIEKGRAGDGGSGAQVPPLFPGAKNIFSS